MHDHQVFPQLTGAGVSGPGWGRPAASNGEPVQQSLVDVGAVQSIGLVAVDAAGLFPRVTTWLGFRRDSVLRGYMVDFASLFAPHLLPELVQRAASMETQQEVEGLFETISLPLRGGCDDEFGTPAGSKAG